MVAILQLATVRHFITLKGEVSKMSNKEGLQFFLVGGAVRDSVIGKVPKDRDFVVVGATAEEMVERGFQAIDAGFPVFLDENGDEFALARKEQKVGRGHKGFEVFSDETVTLEEDLIRRDFTMNAMAMDNDGEIIDPFDGQTDLKNGIVRHVSDAFSEDPLRVLRLARFTARFDFEVAEETIELSKDIVDELTEIPEERIFTEFRKAMKQASNPRKFFEVLEEVGAFEVVMPEIKDMTSILAGPKEFHRDRTVFQHCVDTVDEMFKIRGNDEIALMSAFFHDVGKTTTDDDMLPHHHGHDTAGVKVFEEISDRLKFTNGHGRIIRTVIENHMKIGHFNEMRDSKKIKFVETMDKVEDGMFELLTDVLVADTRATANLEDVDTTEILETASVVRGVIDDIRGDVVVERFPHLEGRQIHDQLTHMRTVEFRERQ